MQPNQIFPFDYCPADLQIVGVVFTRDFGPWKKGYHARCIVVDPEQGKMIEYDANDRILTSCKVSIFCVEEK